VVSWLVISVSEETKFCDEVLFASLCRLSWRTLVDDIYGYKLKLTKCFLLLIARRSFTDFKTVELHSMEHQI
jgi:hypothetical protein